MSRYALVQGKKVIQDALPQTGYLSDGRSVSGYDLLSNEVLRSEGWLPIVDEPPIYNPKTQTLTNNGYVVEVDRVVVAYTVKDIPITIMQ